MPTRMPNSATSRAANESYVMTSSAPWPSWPSSTPARSRAPATRAANSAAAFLVKVRPSTWSGRTWPVPTSQTTRAAITVVFPEPAPAMMTAGSSGAVMAASCSSEKGICRASTSWPGVRMGWRRSG
jgi:hypothetical protein